MMDLKQIKNASFEELQSLSVPFFDTLNELIDFIIVLTEREHDYNTTGMAIMLAAEATFKYIAKTLGASNFQASCSDLELLKRLRHLECGFCILNYEDLLYPQYLNDTHFPSYKDLIRENIEVLAEKAKEKLQTHSDAHPNVILHWKYLVKQGEIKNDQ